jgi:hypothetical protein
MKKGKIKNKLKLSWVILELNLKQIIDRWGISVM